MYSFSRTNSKYRSVKIRGSRWNTTRYTSRFAHRALHQRIGQSIHIFLSFHPISFLSASRHFLNFTRSYSSHINQYDWDEKRKHILSTALTFVDQYGWTDQAVAQGVLSCGYPPSMIGLIPLSGYSSSCHLLIEYYMNDTNQRLRRQLFESTSHEPVPTLASKKERLFYAIQTRLRMNESYLKSKRWSEGMALGMINPRNALVTSHQLDEMLEIIYKFSSDEVFSKATDESISYHPYPISLGNQDSSSVHRMLDKGSIVFLYVVTELFMLTDESEGYKDTWTFLTNKIDQLFSIQNTLPSPLSIFSHLQAGSLMRPEVATAATAVASSFGGAIFSLLTPVAKIGVSSLADVIVPQILSSISQMSPPIKPANSSNMNGTSNIKSD